MSEFTMMDFEGKKIGTILAEEVSDGYHTFTELYRHRFGLFCALVKAYDSLITPLGPTSVRAWKSKLHADGTMFEGHFIAGLTKQTIDQGEIHMTYHLPMSWWDKFKCMERTRAPIYDGHTSEDVLRRIIDL